MRRTRGGLAFRSSTPSPHIRYLYSAYLYNCYLYSVYLYSVYLYSVYLYNAVIGNTRKVQYAPACGPNFGLRS